MSLPTHMKALIKRTDTVSYEYIDIPVPDPKGDEVLIKVDAVSICGSDIALYKWDSVARVIATTPFIPGHETAGTVVKCGPDATVPLGSRVGVENHFYCSSCYQCQNDMREICVNMGQYGHGKKTEHGGCSEYSIVSSRYLYVIKEPLSAEEITMLEPLGVAHNGMEKLEASGQDVLVLGCGPIGILSQQMAKVMGAKRVIAADIEDWKLELAKKAGADIAVNTRDIDIKQFIMEQTSGIGIDRICECTGNPIIVNNMFSYLRKGGQIVMIGLPKQPLHVENVLQDIVFKVLTLRTVHGRRIYRTWKEIERLVADKKVDVNMVVSHRFPMSKFEEAFRVLFSGSACKIVMDPSK